jgi:hypothetical protein
VLHRDQPGEGLSHLNSATKQFAVRRSRRCRCGGRQELPLLNRGDAGGAEARVPQAVAIPQKTNLGSGSALTDRAPLRLCVSASLRQSRPPFAVRGAAVAGGRQELPLLNRRDAGGAEARVPQAVAVPQKKRNREWLSTHRQRVSAPLRLCDKGRRSPFAALPLRRAVGRLYE